MDVELPGYRLIRPLRQGVTDHPQLPEPGRPAVVWRGTRGHDDEPVAVKVFAVEDRERAEREAELCHAVDHRHIVTPIEVVAGSDAAGLVLPWAAGGSLMDLLAARLRLPWPEALTVLIPLADALSAAHERGFVHGDLSAGNVLFDGDGRPLLADFGGARAAVERGIDVAVTPTDVAPEIVRGGEPSPAADLFSLGSVALRCLTGRPAWPAENLQDVLIQSTAGQWPDVDENMAPAALVTVVRRLLCAEPDQRGSAAQAAVGLRDVGTPEPVKLLTDDAHDGAAQLAPATVVRPDAVRPPSHVGGPHAPSTRGWRPVVGMVLRPVLELVRQLRRWWRGLAVTAVVAVLALGAVGTGLWWAGSGQSQPTVAAPAAPTPPAMPGAPTVTSSSTMTSATTAPLATTAPSGTGSSDTAWIDVISGLDAARSMALVMRNPSLLRSVYTADATERSVDERRIEEMASSGYHITDAVHRFQSATAGDRHSDGQVTITVVSSLPSYPVYNAHGAVAGHTAGGQPSTIMVDLSPSGDSFLISQIRAG